MLVADVLARQEGGVVDIRCGEARSVLAALPEQSVHACITSPPYFGLRSYGGGAQEIGAEATPQEYVAALVDVFRAVHRVLRDDGTLWAVLGDSYAGSWGNQGRKAERGTQRPINGPLLQQVHDGRYPAREHNTGACPPGVRPKSLLGIPWRVAFALQDDGWLLRQEVIWAKPNPMPESVRDRCTRAHETVFMLAKGPRYYYDADAIREPMAGAERVRREAGKGMDAVRGFKRDASRHDTAGGMTHAQYGPRLSLLERGGRNRRTVWTVSTTPLSSKKYGCDTEHYAAFPPELVRPMVRAGCPVDGTVLDPFCGSGTTGFVAVQEGRRFIGCDINAAYVRLAQARIATAQPALPLALVAEGLAI